ncbi:hypothetical protein Micbo1qcDRAFT_170968 [Microdochium bolleyi]|uniref:Uncharacterized protein n=1 Tax=Microdochium bolleyi TaxID=196109 RepID=A0A136JJD1_9PEZI|nr:hypothetical protein Micbo1qcDRAFT_170968 [Microdochium bolleyi]
MHIGLRAFRQPLGGSAPGLKEGVPSQSSLDQYFRTEDEHHVSSNQSIITVADFVREFSAYLATQPLRSAYEEIFHLRPSKPTDRALFKACSDPREAKHDHYIGLVNVESIDSLAAGRLTGSYGRLAPRWYYISQVDLIVYLTHHDWRERVSRDCA